MGRFINADVFASTGQGLLGNNLFAYCVNNPCNNIDPNGQFPLTGSVVLLASALIVAIPTIPLLLTPPPAFQKVIINGLDQIFTGIMDAITQTVELLLAKTKGKERVRDSGLAQETDEEIRRKAHDKSLPKSEQRRYQTEEKARGIRNHRKRMEVYK